MASNFLEMLSQLHDHHVDFVIVGGVAAALHGGSRVTFDLDIVPSLAATSWQAAVDLLWSLGARPRIPETLERIRRPKGELTPAPAPNAAILPASHSLPAPASGPTRSSPRSAREEWAKCIGRAMRS